jgi:hypothetical protein
VIAIGIVLLKGPWDVGKAVVPPPPPPPPPQFAAADSVALIGRLTELAATTSSAREGIALYRRVASRLEGPLQAEASFYAARGLVLLRQEREACQLLRSAAKDAAGTRVAEPIATLLSGCPR